MKEFTFLDPWQFVSYALLLLGIAIIAKRGLSRSQKERNLFQAPQGKKSFFKGAMLKHTLQILALILMLMALADPVNNPHHEALKQEGRDVFFVLDVSRSMLAEDCRPNRLEKAKAAIEQSLEMLEGDRVALLAFAGSPSIRCPLTRDRSFFKKMLSEVSPNSVAQGGTRIGDALHKVIDKLMDKDLKGNQDIILISDGEDMESKPLKAIEKINDLEARLIIVGLGDETFGERIPEGDAYVSYKGKEVWTKLNSSSLSELSKACDVGVYYPIGTAPLDLAAIYHHLRKMMPLEVRDVGTELKYDHLYWNFCFLAFLLYGLSLLLQLRLPSFLKNALAIILFVMPLHHELSAGQPLPKEQQLFVQGVSAYKKAKYSQGVEHFQSFLELNPGHAKANYNLAHCEYALNNYEQADLLFHSAEESGESQSFILNCWYNKALCRIRLGLKEEVFFENLPDGEFLDDDEEERISPEEYFHDAESVLRNVLLHQPEYKAAANNLEWVLRKLYQDPDDLQSDLNSNAQPQESQKQEGQEQDAQKESEDDSENSEEGEESDKSDGKPDSSPFCPGHGGFPAVFAPGFPRWVE
ncbi:MAG: VWA domain-containing protein [Planctomycetes bacterium]|nr:VWA domain-containing protein [Planctomycetota bacterium]